MPHFHACCHEHARMHACGCRLVYMSDTVKKKLRAFTVNTGELYWWYYGDKGTMKVGVHALSGPQMEG